MVLFQTVRQLLPQLRFSTSPKNYNSEIGLVLAILEVENYQPHLLGTMRMCLKVFFRSIFWARSYDVLLLEYGIDTVGDMDWLLSIAQPQMSIFTVLDLVHALQLHDGNTILEEKMKLLQATKEIVFTATQAWYVKPYLQEIDIDWLTYDLEGHDDGDISFDTHYLQSHPAYLVVANFNVNQEREKVAEVTTNLLGKEHAAYISLGMEIAMILERRLGLEARTADIQEEREQFFFELQPGRFTVFPGQYGSVLIDSSYNGAPQSMKLTIENVISLRNQIYPEKDIIYCLGDMRELGEFAESEHRTLANQVAKSADEIYLVGERMTSVFVDELEKIWYNMQQVFTFTSSASLWEALVTALPTREKTALVLFKGSQNTIFLEEAIKPLLRDPADKKKLCRQSARWLKKK